MKGKASKWGVSAGLAMMVMVSMAPSATGEHIYTAPQPVSVFIALPDYPRLAEHVRASFQYHAPDFMYLADYRQGADFTVRVHLDDFDSGFRIVDVDRKDKKYSKRYRRAARPCDRLYEAVYDRYKEVGEARFQYRFSVRAFGQTIYQDRDRERVRENFKYARNLRAQTGCGFRQVSVYPSNKIARLFENNRPAVRQHIIVQLRQRAAWHIGAHIAQAATVGLDLVEPQSAHNLSFYFGGRDYWHRHGYPYALEARINRKLDRLERLERRQYRAERRERRHDRADRRERREDRAERRERRHDRADRRDRRKDRAERRERRHDRADRRERREERAQNHRAEQQRFRPVRGKVLHKDLSDDRKKEKRRAKQLERKREQPDRQERRRRSRNGDDPEKP